MCSTPFMRGAAFSTGHAGEDFFLLVEQSERLARFGLENGRAPEGTSGA